jgi:hypothetical protein
MKMNAKAFYEIITTLEQQGDIVLVPGTTQGRAKRALHWKECRFLAAGPLGMETYGPRTTCLALERLSMIRTLLLRLSSFALRRPFLPPVSIPPSMASACVFGSASMHSQFHFHHP